MATVVGWRELGGRGPGNFLFQGEAYGANLSCFVVQFAPGGGPPLHRHPYEEVFLIQEGIAHFTVADEEIDAEGGQVVVVPAAMPHRFVNTGDGPLRLISIQPSPRVVMDVLTEDDGGGSRA